MSVPTYLKWAVSILACVLPYLGFCQIPAPPGNIQSPNASGFGSYGDIPVSPFTGKPDISVNLHNLSDGNVQIPITLTYDPSGVKPEIHPGWTGLNFSLSTTYAVTRQIKDWADDCKYQGSLGQRGWFYTSATLNTTDWTSSTKMETNTDISVLNDLEPDEYSFSLPGLSGKFYYGHDQKWKISCDRPIVVKFLGDQPTVRPPFNVPEFISGGGNPWQNLAGGYMEHMQGFVIIDEFGTEYTFGGGDPAYSEYSMDFFNQGKATWFCNNWYLKTIKRQTGQTINFTYERGAFVAQMNFSVVNKKYQVNGTGGFLNVDCSSSSSAIPLTGPYGGKLISPIYLKEISADNFKVKFVSTTSTELRYEDNVFSQFVNAYTAPPGNGRMQDILTFLYTCFYPTYSGCDASGETLTSLLSKLQWRKLDRIQIQNGGGTTIKEYELTYNNVSNERLMLKKIQEKSGYNTDKLPPYEFTYYAVTGLSLPGYGRSHTDHWGYNNGKLINQTTDFSSYSTYGTTYRNPPTDKRLYLLGSLTEIKYPTGGVTKFKFEPHTFTKEVKLKRWEGWDPYSSNQFAGGLRIKEIHTSDPINHLPQNTPVPTVIKRYYYINGFNPASPDTTSLLSSGILGGKSQYWWPDYTPKPKGNFTYLQQVFSTQSVLPETENSMGMHIGYSEVVENSSTGGWTVHSFSNFDNGYLDEAALGYLQTTTTAYEPYNSNGFKRGKLLEKKAYFQNGNLAQRVETRYGLVGTSENFARSFKSLRTELCPPSSNFAYEGTAYVINTLKFLASEETVYTYDQDIASRSTFAAQKTGYKSNGQVYGIYQTDSKTNPTKIPITPIGPSYNRQILTEYKYANDYTNPTTDAICIDMTGRNMIAAPLEITKRLVTIAAGGGSVSYAPLNWQKVTYKATRLPDKVESKLGTASTSVTEYEFLTYDGRGNLLTYKDKSGTTTKLEYYGTTDVGKVDLVKTRTTADGSTIPQTTTYDHKPLVGISKTTDPNGKAIDYEYDKFNRLEFVKSAGSVRASYCYNYAGQVVKCNALAPMGSIAANTPALIPDDALPVTLVEFTAKKSEKTALLQWSTTSERNSKLFEIQRSNDGKNWVVIGMVDAKGESNELERYSFTDMSPLLSKSKQKQPAENLYRLKMIDLDETFAYSRIQSLVFENGDGVSLFPNPIAVGNNLNIAIDDISTIRAVKIYDASGRLVHQSGAAKKVNTNILAAGMYIVEITYKDGSVTTHRIVKQ